MSSITTPSPLAASHAAGQAKRSRGGSAAHPLPTSPPCKRVRYIVEPALGGTSPTVAATGEERLSAMLRSARIHSQTPCAFPARSPDLKSLVDRPADDDHLYSRDEVDKILTRALSKQQAVLREEYNRILHDKLSEQFHTFTQFNQDYVSRQIRKSEFSYLS